MSALPNPPATSTLRRGGSGTAIAFVLAYLVTSLVWVAFRLLVHCLSSEDCYAGDFGSSLAFFLTSSLSQVYLGVVGILFWLRKREERCGSLQVVPLGPVLACFIVFSLVGRLGFYAIEFPLALWSIPSLLRLAVIHGVELLCDTLLPLGLALYLSKHGLRGTPKTVAELPMLSAWYIPLILALGFGGLSSPHPTSELTGALLLAIWLGVVFLAARQSTLAASAALPILHTVGACLVLLVLDAVAAAVFALVYKVGVSILSLSGLQWLLQSVVWLLHGALLWWLTRLSIHIMAQPSAR
ncbi:MAG: hypothetical protein GAK43_02354 [Stenotrophomonas maltophilia]|nr:MAG: hypothetical protein GAK43_02354 [Stenotrophomonas maltophilia]